MKVKALVPFDVTDEVKRELDDIYVTWKTKMIAIPRTMSSRITQIVL